MENIKRYYFKSPDRENDSHFFDNFQIDKEMGALIFANGDKYAVYFSYDDFPYLIKQLRKIEKETSFKLYQAYVEITPFNVFFLSKSKRIKLIPFKQGARILNTGNELPIELIPSLIINMEIICRFSGIPYEYRYD